MPAMIRSNKKATKIAYKLLGKPDNFFDDKKKKSKLEQQLTFQETIRVR